MNEAVPDSSSTLFPLLANGRQDNNFSQDRGKRNDSQEENSDAAAVRGKDDEGWRASCKSLEEKNRRCYPWEKKNVMIALSFINK